MFSDPYILNADMWRAEKMEKKKIFLFWFKNRTELSLLLNSRKQMQESRPLPYLSSNRSALNHIFKLYYGLT